MTGAPDDWTRVESAWRGMERPGTADSVGWAVVKRRLAFLAVLDLAIALAFLALGATVLLEHRGGLAWLASLLLGVQGALTAALATTTRRAVHCIVPVSTREFLEDWSRSCRRRLAWIRGLAALLFTEVVTLGVWIAVDTRSDAPRILAEERWWYGALIAVLAVAVWLGIIRARTLAALGRIAVAQAELGEPPAGGPQ